MGDIHDDLREVMGLLGKATPGDWFWIERHSGHLEIAAPHGGGTTVMDFQRKGMRGAEPRFGICLDGGPRGKRGGVLVGASELMASDPDRVLRHPDAESLVAAVNFLRQHGPALLARQEGEDAESVPATIAGWVHEDELPEGYPYDALFPFSRVDIVRMFPVYVPRSP